MSYDNNTYLYPSPILTSQPQPSPKVAVRLPGAHPAHCSGTSTGIGRT